MANQYANKVVVNGRAIIDLTGDTVAPESLLEGIRAHDSSGAPIIGTAKAGGDCIAYTKEVTLSSTQTLLASLQELVDAGFISNDTTDPGQIWKNYDVILVRKPGNPQSNLITESRASSHSVISNSTNRLYYKNALRVTSSNYSAIGTTETITSNTAGYISIGTSGLIVTPSSSFVYNGNYDLLIYASGKK